MKYHECFRVQLLGQDQRVPFETSMSRQSQCKDAIVELLKPLDLRGLIRFETQTVNRDLWLIASVGESGNLDWIEGESLDLPDDHVPYEISSVKSHLRLTMNRLSELANLGALSVAAFERYQSKEQARSQYEPETALLKFGIRCRDNLAIADHEGKVQDINFAGLPRQHVSDETLDVEFVVKSLENKKAVIRLSPSAMANTGSLKSVTNLWYPPSLDRDVVCDRLYQGMRKGELLRSKALCIESLLGEFRGVVLTTYPELVTDEPIA